ncbi:enoyl-CoA hydratase/isomerase family protein [Mycolicibacterium peregrinum]|uniref:enoyl-CoA hydratase/isomerase family protein n=1 Tax=Mycolicibacterium peregrinum TaxID=43304 RepID=UPI000A76E2CA|nr:enoyl-CoA hydratase/isomerase family protein [Mycolicibacterium peregrinum]
MSAPLLIEYVSPGVVVLTLNVHERRNAMTAELSEAWAQAMAALRSDRTLRAAIVTGAGTAFCAGGDLDWLESTVRSHGSMSALRSTMSNFYQMWLSIRELPVPSIAAVNGPAIGAGLCLALACDLRYAAPGAKFSAPFTSLGVHPGMAATALLPEAVGMPRAREMFFTGRVIAAEEAVQWGLAASVVDDVVAHAIEVAGAIAATDAMAVELTKAALIHPHRTVAEGLTWESFAQPMTMAQGMAGSAVSVPQAGR